MMNKIPKGWEKYYLSDCFNAISIKNKIKTKDYLPQGKFPIIDQGQDFISGYSNDENLLIKVKKPIVISFCLTIGFYFYMKKQINNLKWI